MVIIIIIIMIYNFTENYNFCEKSAVDRFRFVYLNLKLFRSAMLHYKYYIISSGNTFGN